MKTSSIIETSEKYKAQVYLKEQAVQALKPFALLYKNSLRVYSDDRKIFEYEGQFVTLGDLRKAKLIVETY